MWSAERNGGGANAGRRLAMAVLLAVSVGAGVVLADVRLLVPDQSPSGPFYARIERGLIHHTDDWAAIAFYREPTCVRPTFNLLNFFDFANIPQIFDCPLTVHGFEIWKNGPATDAGPIQSKLHGNGAVPVWFVSWTDLQAALPGLTTTELLAMPSLMQGTAGFFEETLHPSGIARQGMLELVAIGVLPDGRSFQYEATEAAGELQRVMIEFK